MLCEYTGRHGSIVEWLPLCLVFGKSRVQISAWKPVILTEIFNGLPQSLKANAGIKPQISVRPLPSKFFPVHNLLITPSFDSI
jgi:hypothetical protein